MDAIQLAATLAAVVLVASIVSVEAADLPCGSGGRPELHAPAARGVARDRRRV
jgi:hypothetical protein